MKTDIQGGYDAENSAALRISKMECRCTNGIIRHPGVIDTQAKTSTILRAAAEVCALAAESFTARAPGLRGLQIRLERWPVTQRGAAIQPFPLCPRFACQQ
jgi:hypothetical protein